MRGTDGPVIHVVLGTKAQLVKMAPIMVRLREREIAYRFVHTGQHQATMGEMLTEFGLKPPDVVLHSLASPDGRVDRQDPLAVPDPQTRNLR